MSDEQVFRSVTCLGCGCGCDDLEVRVREGRIVGLAPPCPVATRWFGDGSAPAEIRVDARPATLEGAIAGWLSNASKSRHGSLLH